MDTDSAQFPTQPKVVRARQARVTPTTRLQQVEKERDQMRARAMQAEEEVHVLRLQREDLSECNKRQTKVIDYLQSQVTQRILADLDPAFAEGLQREAESCAQAPYESPDGDDSYVCRGDTEGKCCNQPEACVLGLAEPHHRPETAAEASSDTAGSDDTDSPSSSVLGDLRASTIVINVPAGASLTLVIGG